MEFKFEKSFNFLDVKLLELLALINLFLIKMELTFLKLFNILTKTMHFMDLNAKNIYQISTIYN